MRVYLLLAGLAFVIAATVTPVLRAIGKRTMADIPVRARDVHAEKIPKLGGVSIILAFMVGLGAASTAPFLTGVFIRPDVVSGLVLASIVVLIIGVADDLFELRWYYKLIGQLAASLIMAVSGVRLEVLPVGWVQIDSPVWQIGAAMFLMIMTMNAINFVDGLDGLAAGTAAIGSAAFFVYCYMLANQVNQYDHANLGALLMAILLGASLGFLVHNFNPAKIFMGESGAMMIGLIMSVATIVVTADLRAMDGERFRNIPAYMPILLPIAVIALPLVDLFLSILRRAARGRSPFTADRGHLHHRLIDGGYTHRGAVLLLYLWSGIVAFGSIFINRMPAPVIVPLWVVLLVGAGLLTIHPWIRHKLAQRTEHQHRHLHVKRKGRL